MTKEMIVSSNGHETRVAILEEDLVAEIFIERERQRGVVGNVYKGRVSKVLPGMQSSFIDVGLERDGFLYVGDVLAATDELDRLESGELEDDASGKADKEELAADATREPPGESGRPEPSAAPRPRDDGRRDRDKPQLKIEELLREGQEIIVQVVKEPLGTKG